MAGLADRLGVRALGTPVRGMPAGSSGEFAFAPLRAYRWYLRSTAVAAWSPQRVGRICSGSST